MAIASVASAAGDTSLASENGTRGGFTITNTDANRLYVLLDGGTASATNYSFYLDSGDTASMTGYTGAIKGIWAADGAGAALVTTWGR